MPLTINAIECVIKYRTFLTTIQMTYFYLGKIPEGYVEYTKFEMPDIETIIYATSDGCLLTFSYSSDSSAITYWIKEDCYSVESVYFSNCSGDFYTAQDPSKGNCFIWYGYNSSTIFYLSGYLEKDELIVLAENMREK